MSSEKSEILPQIISLASVILPHTISIVGAIITYCNYKQTRSINESKNLQQYGEHKKLFIETLDHLKVLKYKNPMHIYSKLYPNNNITTYNTEKINIKPFINSLYEIEKITDCYLQFQDFELKNKDNEWLYLYMYVMDEVDIRASKIADLMQMNIDSKTRAFFYAIEDFIKIYGELRSIANFCGEDIHCKRLERKIAKAYKISLKIHTVDMICNIENYDIEVQQIDKLLVGFLWHFSLGFKEAIKKKYKNFEEELEYCYVMSAEKSIMDRDASAVTLKNWATRTFECNNEMNIFFIMIHKYYSIALGKKQERGEAIELERIRNIVKMNFKIKEKS